MTRNQKYYFQAIIGSMLLVFGCTSNEVSDSEAFSLGQSGLIYTADEAILDADSNWVAPDRSMLGLYEQRVSAETHLGEYAIQTNAAQPYAFTNSPPGGAPNRWMHLKAWVKGDGGLLVVSIMDHDGFRQSGAESTGKTAEDGWHQIEFYCMLPLDYVDAKISCYAYSAQEATLFWDAFELHWDEPLSYQEFEESIGLTIGEESMSQLLAKRNEAFETGVLFSKKEDYVPATYTDFIGKEHNAEIRLKGDWLDHLEKNKWSYRVVLENGHVFSVHNPSARNFMHEWVFQRIAEQEGLRTTDYSFCGLNINGVSNGVYAKELHFSDTSFFDGPVFNFDEATMWELNAIAIQDNNRSPELHLFPYLEAARIKVFSQAYWEATPERERLVAIGRSKLAALRDGKDPEGLIDFDKTARFYALSDVFETNHGITWHNRRWQLNPETELLEPVVYDAFGNEEESKMKRPFMANQNQYETTTYSLEDVLSYHVFNNKKFTTQYFDCLEKYASEKWLQQVLDGLAIDHNEQKLQNEFPEYQFSTEAILERIEFFKAVLEYEEENMPEPYTYARWEGVGETNFSATPMMWQGLQVEPTAQRDSLKVYSFWTGSIKVIGYGEKKKTPQYILTEPWELSYTPSMTNIAMHGKAQMVVPWQEEVPRYFFYTADGLPEVHLLKTN